MRNTNMNIKTIQLFFLLILGFSSNAMARPYLGASGGISAVDSSGYKAGLSQKLFAGLRYQDSGLEVAFVNLGDFKANNGTGTVRVTGVSMSIMPYFQVNKTFELFGKFGGFAWNLSTPANNTTFVNTDGFSYNLGFGANVNIFRHFTLRIELQKFYQIGAASSGGSGASGTAISTATAGAVFVF